MSSSISEVSDKAFDFVVIGGGTAGLVVATRLAENPAVTVAVLEAGQDNYKDFLISVSGQQGNWIGNPNYDWFFQTKPQALSNGTPVLWPRGRVLGGTSALNHFVWNIPSTQEIDAWEKLGNPGWNGKTLLPYYRKVEGFDLLPNANGEKFKQLYPLESLGSSGPVKLTVTDSIMEAETVIEETLSNAGVPSAKNPFGGDPVGTFIAPSTIDIKTFTRSSAATAYYEPNKGKSNLKVLCRVRAHRLKKAVGQEGEPFHATAVEFEWNGELHSVGVKREVILSAGVPKSPQFLELSGIGDRKILEPLGITTHLDLPGVGANLQEHYGTFTICELAPHHDSITLDILDDEAIAAGHRALFAEKKGIHCCSLPRLAMVPFYSVTDAPEEAMAIIERQRKHVEELSAKGAISEGLRAQYELVLQAYESGKAGNCELIAFPKFVVPGMAQKGKKYFTFVGGINHAFSRGTVHVKSSDPKEEPEIDPHYLEADVDREILLNHLKLIRRLETMEPLKGILAAEVIPGANVKTDADLEAHLKGALATLFHPTSSLSMLPREHNGVVDPKLRVYGTDNVRVVDLSIVPLAVGAHVQATAYAIGERAADIIKADWKA